MLMREQCPSVRSDLRHVTAGWQLKLTVLRPQVCGTRALRDDVV